jgi:hypothetical protein
MSTSQLTTLELSSTQVIWEGYLKQDWKCTYKVTLSRVRVIFIPTLRHTTYVARRGRLYGDLRSLTTIKRILNSSRNVTDFNQI